MMDELHLEELSVRMMLVKMDDAFCQALESNQRRHGERGDRRLKATWHQKSKNSDSRRLTGRQSLHIMGM
jgi:hypothetical protein